MGDNASNSGPKSTFEAYKAEGDMLFKQQEFIKALESYNQALEMRDEDKNCLISRSRCYLQMGDTENALKDAEASMQDDPSFFKGLLCKADALYFKGEFEMALVFYHRGNKLRPEQHEFRLGIQKCKEAIDNSVGSPDRVKLHKGGDLSYFYKPLEEEAAMKKKQQQLKTGRRITQEVRKKPRPISGNKDKTIKQLLGSLYADREFLEKLLKEEANRLDELGTCSKCGYRQSVCSCQTNLQRDYDHASKYALDTGDEGNFKLYSERFKNKKIVLVPESSKKKDSLYSDDDEEEVPKRNVGRQRDAKHMKTKTSEDIQNLVLDGLIYLDTRTDFWRQQKPMYARKRDKDLQNARLSKKANDPVKYTLRKLKEIDEAHSRGKYKEVIKETTKIKKSVSTWDEEELNNKQEVLASLHSSAGNAYLELGDYENALGEHQKDLEIAGLLSNEELESRAMDNLGRVYARMGKFEDAIDIWERKVERKPEMQELEAAWLYHELGRCYLEVGNTDQALNYGEKSYSNAQNAEDEIWQLHSSVLIAQAQAKREEYEASIDSFERALEFAKLQEDDDAENAIKNAMKEVNEKITQKLSEEPKPFQNFDDDDGDDDDSEADEGDVNSDGIRDTNDNDEADEVSEEEEA